MLALSNDARSALFSPLEDAAGRGEAVSRRLAAAIVLGLIDDGEQLPAEEQLAASLNVSKMTLRLALADLRDRGLVVTRRGRWGGSFARTSPDLLDTFARARLSESSVSQLRELGDVHTMVAGMSARLAADRASPTEVSRLSDLTGRMASSSGGAELRRIDGRFWVELAAAAQSARMTRAAIDLQAELALYPTHPDLTDQRKGIVAGRRKVVHAVAGARGEEARRVAERQVQLQARRLIEARLALARETGARRG